MVMAFAEPIWLWALSGLIVPLAIHLLSRKEGRIQPMGSVRYLREASTAKYKTFRLNEIALLLLRCLLVALIVFLLARARTSWFHMPAPKWAVLEEGVEKSDQMKPVIQTLQDHGFEIRMMASGFPLLSKATVESPIDDYWSAVRKLTTHSLDSVVVITFNYQRNFKGERIPIPPNMKWLIADAQAKEFIAERILMENDSVWVREGQTTRFITKFQTRKAALPSLPDSVPATLEKQVHISVVVGEDFGYDGKILLAALRAIQSVTPHKLNVTSLRVNEAISSSENVVFWMANEQLSTRQDVITISYRNCLRKNLPLLMPSSEAVHDCGHAQNADWILTKRLNEETALKENLALQLARVVLPSEPADQHDRRVLPESMIWATGNKDTFGTVEKKQAGDLDLFLTILLLFTLLTERTLAYKRNQ